eukprot:m.70590 g.70590  ORF g.70590 m.70590 type:complete len:215 (+) comp18527_c0_seq1:28-672(+)
MRTCTMGGGSWAVVVGVVAALVVGGESVSFILSADKDLCLQEDVQKDVLVVGNYEVAPGGGTEFPVTIEITDSNKHRVYMKELATEGKFAFTSDDTDVFSICFLSQNKGQHAGATRDATLVIKTGVEAKSYDNIAKAEKLKPMEMELRRLEDLSESIVSNFARMKQREEEHRDTNESTNERVLHMSALSMMFLVGLAVWQVLYLKSYFKSKKLI